MNNLTYEQWKQEVDRHLQERTAGCLDLADLATDYLFSAYAENMTVEAIVLTIVEDPWTRYALGHS